MQTLFLQLDEILQHHQELWRFEPFHQSEHIELPWLAVYPEFCQWLSSLSTEQIVSYKESTNSLIKDAKATFPEAEQLSELVLLSNQGIRPMTLTKGADVGIPGRKLTQITAMGSFALAHHQGSEWLEWCSGKGYLGRILATHSKQPVVSFEWQESLCAAGQRDADKQKLPMTFVQGDALSDESRRVFFADQHAVALHACGDLHVNLLKRASEAGSKAITISPCCYHLTRHQDYQPLSPLGIASSLSLSKSELRIPLQETVTGGKRVHRHRKTEMQYRLGFDLILKQCLRLQEYVSIPSIKKSQLSLGFEHFCLWAAKQKSIQLPELDFVHWQRKGVERFWRMERLGLAQQLFRRPLELWLVYDKAMYLEHRGYQVSVAQFCEREVTPRNIIIHAKR